MPQPLITLPNRPAPQIAPPMLIETQRYTDRVGGSDPEATTDQIDRRQLAAIVEEMRSPNRIARDVLKETWAHARVRRTEVILDRRGFRRAWRKQRDLAVESGDVATAMLGQALIRAIDRMTPECLVVCLCDIDGQTWEIFVDTDREEPLGCRPRKDIW